MDIGEAVVSVVIVSMLLLAGMQALNADLQNNPVPTTATSDAPLLTTEGYVQVADRPGEGRDETVVNSRGLAVELTGANDSYIESDGAFTIANDANWTVSTWASTNASAVGDTMTALSANGRVLLQYNGTAGNWSVWYYDDGSRSSWRLSTSAPNQPNALTHVAAWHNGTHLALYRNGSREAIENTSTGANIATAELNATNWHGRLEETRTFDDALNASQFAAVTTEPVEPLASAKPTARLMYDQSGSNTVRIYFAPTTATLSNGSYVDGFDGATMTRGADYQWRKSGPKIKALPGGRLAGAPVAFVDYHLTDEFSRVMMAKNYEVLLNQTPLIFTTIVLVLIGTYLTLLRRR